MCWRGGPPLSIRFPGVSSPPWSWPWRSRPGRALALLLQGECAGCICPPGPAGAGRCVQPLASRGASSSGCGRLGGEEGQGQDCPLESQVSEPSSFLGAQIPPSRGQAWCQGKLEQGGGTTGSIHSQHSNAAGQAFSLPQFEGVKGSD